MLFEISKNLGKSDSYFTSLRTNHKKIKIYKRLIKPRFAKLNPHKKPTGSQFAKINPRQHFCP